MRTLLLVSLWLAPAVVVAQDEFLRAHGFDATVPPLSSALAPSKAGGGAGSGSGGSSGGGGSSPPPGHPSKPPSPHHPPSSSPSPSCLPLPTLPGVCLPPIPTLP